MNIPSKHSQFSTKLIPSVRRPIRLLLGLASLLVMAALVAPVIAANAAPGATINPSSNVQQLKNQSQTSLEVAASTAHDGIGQRVDKPAANIVGESRHVQPSDVLPDAKSGISIIGCLTDYGIPGVQCVPARSPGNLPVSCNFIHTMFPHGIAINGTDRLGLKTSGDTACGV